MIILRQINYSLDYKQLFPRVNKDLDVDIEGILPENIIKSILKDWKNTIVKNIWEDESKFGEKHNLKEQDFVDGLELSEVSYGVWEKDELELTFSASKNTKLHNIYGPYFFWSLSFSGKTGKFINLIAGD